MTNPAKNSISFEERITEVATMMVISHHTLPLKDITAAYIKSLTLLCDAIKDRDSVHPSTLVNENHFLTPQENNKVVALKQTDTTSLPSTQSPQVIHDDIANKFVKAITYARECTYPHPYLDNKTTFINFVDARGFSISHFETHAYTGRAQSSRLYRINATVLSNSDISIRYGIINDGMFVVCSTIVKSQDQLNSENNDIHSIVRNMFALDDTIPK